MSTPILIMMICLNQRYLNGPFIFFLFFWNYTYFEQRTIYGPKTHVLVYGLPTLKIAASNTPSTGQMPSFRPDLLFVQLHNNVSQTGSRHHLRDAAETGQVWRLAQPVGQRQRKRATSRAMHPIGLHSMHSKCWLNCFWLIWQRLQLAELWL